MIRQHNRWRVAALLGSVALVGGGLSSFAAPASAGRVADTARAAANVPCKPGQRISHPPRVQDTRLIGSREISAVTSKVANDPVSMTARMAATNITEPVTPVQIPVRVHSLRASSTTPYVTLARAQQAVQTLNDAYAGKQNLTAAQTPFTFRLVDFDRTRNKSWYYANQGSTAERQMKRSLHEGGPKNLNIYFTNPSDHRTFGWATFPWDYSRKPRLDGLVISLRSLPGGNAYNYNLGDTTVHESGHWMGLLHTFQGGCSPYPNAGGDRVADTPAEAKPSFKCETWRDTCVSPGLDPVHNFMDYSYDACMYAFSNDQSVRMQQMFNQYR